MSKSSSILWLILFGLGLIIMALITIAPFILGFYATGYLLTAFGAPIPGMFWIQIVGGAILEVILIAPVVILWAAFLAIAGST